MKDTHYYPRAFTVVEVAITGALMSLLVVLFASAWHGLGRSCVDAIGRSRVTQEALLATESLSHDLSGMLYGVPTGSKENGKYVGRSIGVGPRLDLCFDANGDGLANWHPLDVNVMYYIENGNLVRYDFWAPTRFVVASCVDSWEVLDLGDRLEIRLTFTYRDVSHTYTFIARDP